MSSAMSTCPIEGCDVERNAHIDGHIRAAHSPEQLGMGPYPPTEETLLDRAGARDPVAVEV